MYLHLHDFGIAYDLRNYSKHVKTATGMVKGTPSYCSPEQIKCTDSQCLNKIDSWALGVIAYQLCGLKLPFNGFQTVQIIYSITMTKPDPLPEIYSQELRDLIMSLLSKKHEDRPSID